ncbi:MAG: transglycosylase SLT domain-containing protein [Polyangiaceae bacterium]
MGVEIPVLAHAPDGDLGMPHIEVVFADPRLAVVRALHEGRDDAQAARELDRLRSMLLLSPSQARSWSYVAGRLHLAAGESMAASAAFEFAAEAGSDGGRADELAPYAALRRAEALVRAGRADEALGTLDGVRDVAAVEEVQLARADALASKGDRAAAVDVWRLLLADNPHGVRWVDTSMQLARALLDGVGGAALGHAQEVLELATRVLVEAPAVADDVDAEAVRARAASLLHRGAPRSLTLEERVWQAQALLDESQPKRARLASEAVLKAVPLGDREHAEVACKAAVVLAQAVPHGKADRAADDWGLAISRCSQQDDALVNALYQGAKASASAKRTAEALSRFADVEKRFPAHRLADDARFRSAILVGDAGDTARSLSMFESIADAYPSGDMAADGLFRVALDKLARRDWAAARGILDRLLSLSPESLGWSSAGRAEYFRARVAELSGDEGDAKTRYAAIVGSRPLSYYMISAYSRLRAKDESLARAALDAGVGRESPGPFFTHAHPEIESPAFARFVRLLEVGETDAARSEAAAAGLSGEHTDPEVLWAVAWLFDQAGAPELGHSFARARLVDYRSHWPAGRWRVAWETAFPRPWDGIVLRESESSRIPAPLTWAIMREESAFKPEAKSPASALGLMQLMATTARLVAGGTSYATDGDALLRPEVSIALGTRLLSSLRTSFPARPALAIAAYNGGAVAVRRWIQEHAEDDFDVFVERIPFEETRNYVKRVLASEAAYAFLYAPAVFDEVVSSLGVMSPVAGSPSRAAIPTCDARQ